MTFYNSLTRDLHNRGEFSLATAIHCTRLCPISVRKIIITCCQVQQTPLDPFSESNVPTLYYPYSPRTQCSVSAFVDSIRDSVQSATKASILWTCARTCPEPSEYDESDQVRQDGFTKEVNAGQTVFSDHQLNSYSALFRNRPGANDPGQWWVDQVHEIRDGFFRNLQTKKVIYPHVNRNKGVSDETHALYHSFTRTSGTHVRTVDLETFYHRTGIKIQGNTELRSAWKFNNLKPRYYYALGGQQYWTARYVKPIATALMEAIPSTFMKMRSYPPDHITTSLEEDSVYYWDFSSFTTRLSELKHFLWFLARAAEAHHVTVTLFDLVLGFVCKPLYELLDEYNEVTNISAPYEIHRFFGTYLSHVPDTLRMMNSGPLGVAGNIGFSTALHGLIVCRECGAHRCVCVGDDGLGATVSGLGTLGPSLATLGDINEDKFGILHANDQESHGKFLKRRLQRSGNYLTLSYLYNLPIPAYIDGRGSHRTLPLRFDLDARIHKFLAQTSALLWDLLEHPVSLASSSVILTYLRTAYQMLGLPVTGRMPGAVITPTELAHEDPAGTLRVYLPIPRLAGLDPCHVDWLDHLFLYPPDPYARVPIFGFRRPMEYYKMAAGEVVHGSKDAWLLLMEDCGYFSVEEMSTWVRVDSDGSIGTLRRWLRSSGQESEFVRMCEITCIEVPPVHLLAVHRREEFRMEDTVMEDI